MKSGLSIDNLSIQIGEQAIISDCSYIFRQSELYVIFGKSGSGKSTLLKSLSNLIPYEGGVFLNGKNIQNMQPQVARRRIHYLHQEPILFPGTVLDNLKFPFELKHNFGLVYSSKRVDELMHLMGLDSSILNKNSDTVSGGEKQRIAVVRSLLLEPDFVLLDEPSSALDIASEGQLIGILQALSKTMGIIVVSHSARVIQSATVPVLLEDHLLKPTELPLTLDKIYRMVGDELSNY